MSASYVWHDLVRNPRRTLAALSGIALGIGLFSAVLFFIDGSSASMTQRAVAPLPIDMQRVLTAPLGGRLQLTATVEPPGPPSPGDRITLRLELVNGGTSPANEVVLRSEPSAGLAYVPASARVRGGPVAGGETENPFARGPAKTGLNVGTVAPGETVAASYEVEAHGVDTAADGPVIDTSFSSREVVTPVPANAPAPLGPQDLADRIADVDGVAAADPLSFVDLPPGSLSAGGRTLADGLRVFAFDAGYQRRHPDIDVVAGGQTPGGTLLSVEAARQLGVTVADTVSLAVPGADRPLQLAVSGEADLHRARALFSSRQGSNLEDFLYTPNSVVVDPDVFQRDVVPGLLAATAARGSERNLPVREVDVQVARDLLDADPGTALAQTRQISADVTAIAPEQDYLIDNISNTLAVARADAALAKRMFLFLGLPGALLAAVLAAYAGAVLAGAQRREQALLRVRGADRRHLVRMLLLRTVLLTTVGAAIGLGLGLLSAVAVLGADALTRAPTSSLVVSGLIGACGGFLAAAIALYLAGRAAIRREINEDRAVLFSRPPAWWRFRPDVLALYGIGVLAVIATGQDAFAGVRGSVYAGRGVDLQLWLLTFPLGLWICGCLAGGRLFAFSLAHLPQRPGRFRRVVRGLLGRSLRRRSWVSTQAMAVIALIVAAATSTILFTASYDRAKAADARFSLGSDLRVAPEPTSGESADADLAGMVAAVDGVAAVTPVVYGVENAKVRSTHEEDVANVAAVDPRGFLRVAAVEDDDFVGLTAEAAMATLADDPAGALLSTEMADFLSVEPGDPILVLFAQGTEAQHTAQMHVAGLFERLPAFPDGADALVGIAQQQRLIPSTTPDFFLARTRDERPATLHAAAAAISAGLPTGPRTDVETRETTLDRDQSSLAALNIHGLLTLDAAYALAMVVVAVGMFVFGLLLQRRREYVTLRAQGLQSRELRALVVAEAGAVTLTGCLAGLVVGVGMAAFSVAVLRPLFVLTPRLVLPPRDLLVLVALVVAATLVSSLAASALIRRLKPTELLRDD